MDNPGVREGRDDANTPPRNAEDLDEPAPASIAEDLGGPVTPDADAEMTAPGISSSSYAAPVFGNSFVNAPFAFDYVSHHNDGHCRRRPQGSATSSDLQELWGSAHLYEDFDSHIAEFINNRFHPR